MPTMTDAEVSERWLRYTDENGDKSVHQLESPVEFAKYLINSKQVRDLHKQISWLWVAVLILALGDVVLSILVMYLTLLVRSL